MRDVGPPDFICGRDIPLATVGMFERPEWGGGFYARFAPGETVRVRQPIPSIVLQSLGRPLPPFASASLFIDHAPDFEIDLIYEAPWLKVEPVQSPNRLRHLRPRQRVVLCEQSLAGRLDRMSGVLQTDLLIAGEPGDLAILAEALAIIVTGNVLIALDISELFSIAGRSNHRNARGRVIVSRGLCNTEIIASLRAWIDGVTRDGFGGTLLFMQLASNDAAERLSLVELENFCQVAFANNVNRPLLATAAIEASVTAGIVIAFSGSPS